MCKYNMSMSTSFLHYKSNILSRRQFVLFAAGILLVACATGNAQQNNQGSSSQQLSIQNKGSDTMVNLALGWAEAYHQEMPAVSIAVTGGGSGTGIAALINGTLDIANASRAMKESEIEEAKANGIEPVEYVVAIDALAIIVHPDNPVSHLTIDY